MITSLNDILLNLTILIFSSDTPLSPCQMLSIICRENKTKQNTYHDTVFLGFSPGNHGIVITLTARHHHQTYVLCGVLLLLLLRPRFCRLSFLYRVLKLIITTIINICVVDYLHNRRRVARVVILICEQIRGVINLCSFIHS